MDEKVIAIQAFKCPKWYEKHINCLTLGQPMGRRKLCDKKSHRTVLTVWRSAIYKPPTPQRLLVAAADDLLFN
jgi:hypothetical protein